MPVYSIEISSKVEEEIVDKLLFKFIEDYGDEWKIEWVKWAENRSKMHHQYTAWMEYPLTKIEINTKIKSWEDYMLLSADEQKKLRKPRLGTIMTEHYDEWYAGKWKKKGETKLTSTVISGYIRKGGPLVLNGYDIINIKKK